MSAEHTANRWDPDLYRARASFVPVLGAGLVDLLAPAAGEHILDLGCGTGELTERIAAAGASVVGLDASAQMVEAARQRAPGLTFVIGNGEMLTYDDEFDGVFSNAALHWMLRPEKVASGVARALRPGGRFVAEFGGKRCIEAVRRCVGAALVRRGEDPAAWMRWYFPDVADYVGVLTGAGLEVTFAHLFDRPTPVEGEDGLAAWLKTFLPRLEERFASEWPELAHQIEEAAAPALRRDGGWVLDYTRLRVVAYKPRH